MSVFFDDVMLAHHLWQHRHIFQDGRHVNGLRDAVIGYFDRANSTNYNVSVYVISRHNIGSIKRSRSSPCFLHCVCFPREFVVADITSKTDGHITARLVVDPHFKEPFKISKSLCSLEYRSHLDAQPDLFVGTETRMVIKVEDMCARMHNSYAACSGSWDIPPWRSLPNVLSNWFVPRDISQVLSNYRGLKKRIREKQIKSSMGG